MPEIPQPLLKPGQLLARGVCRCLASLGFSCVEEVVPASGLRVDVMGLGPEGEIWIVECKSSRADYMSDTKWRGYVPYCDRYFWAVDERFPIDLLPSETGLVIADSYGAEILQMGPEARMAGARRKAMVQKFAHHAARRLQALRDPGLTLAGY